MAEWDKNVNDQDDYLDTDNDKVQDSSNADAAKFNADEQERVVNERAAAEYQTDAGIKADNSHTTGSTLTTQGNAAEVEGDLGGTTNLSLDQLKQERDPEK